MKPLKVVFTLSSPMVAPEHPVQLDSLLAWALLQERIDEAEFDEDNAAVTIEDVLRDIPLEWNPDGCWKSSWITLYKRREDSLQAFVRKADVEYYSDLWNKDKGSNPFDSNQTIINLQSGALRNFMYHKMFSDVVRAEAYCIGDAERVRSLLGRVISLGKMGRLGNGRIASVSVTEDPAANLLWHQRFMPVRTENHPVAIRGACLPPYWSPDNRRIVWVDEKMDFLRFAE